MNMPIPGSVATTVTPQVGHFQKSPKGTFATGKGTTAMIRDYFDNMNCSYSVSDFAADVGKDGQERQLNKRFSELVKTGYLVKADAKDHNGNTLFVRAASPLLSDYVANTSAIIA